MLDSLRFWTSDQLNEYEKEACNLLTMNVERFTPIIKNLHGHNFQSSWRVATHIGNLHPIKSKLSDARLKLTGLKKNPHASRGMVRSWWKSLLSSRPKRLTFLFGLCPSSLLRKISPLCCILFDVVRTCGFWRIHPFRMLSTKTEIKLVSLKMQLGWETVSFYHVDTLLFSSNRRRLDWSDVRQIKLMPCVLQYDLQCIPYLMLK